MILFSLLAAALVSAQSPYNMTYLVESQGYPLQLHSVPTEDGYILGVFRIPYSPSSPVVPGQRKPVAFLQHGLLDCSCTWVCNSPKESLGFLLADAGFDVWMGNSRGNTYSLKNVFYPVDSDAFWEWTFDEMAKYDIPAMLSYALNVTGAQTLSYAGHSQGTVQMFIALTTNPAVAKMVNAYAALAPVAYVGNVPNLLFQAMAKFDFAQLLQLFGVRQFEANSFIINKTFPVICKLAPWICQDALFYLMGYDRNNDMNSTRLPIYTSFDPAGTGTYNMAHWAQGIKQDTFAAMDWGKAGNLKHYNSTVAPVYHLSAYPITQTPLHLFTGGHDNLADPKDVARMMTELPSGFEYINIDQYNHLDFVWGETAFATVYNHLIHFFNKYNK